MLTISSTATSRTWRQDAAHGLTCASVSKAASFSLPVVAESAFEDRSKLARTAQEITGTLSFSRMLEHVAYELVF
jgi:hypothetical protein